MLEIAKKEDLQELSEHWKVICSKHGDEGIVFANDLRGKISSLISELSSPEFFAYVIKNKDGEYIALLDVIHALPKTAISWLKIFDMTMTPAYTLGDGNLKALGSALAEAIVISPISLLFGEDHNNAKEVKIFGRTKSMINLYKEISNNEEIQKNILALDIVCSQEGQWLKFRKK